MHGLFENIKINVFQPLNMYLIELDFNEGDRAEKNEKIRIPRENINNTEA